jgi:uncharacterized RDD family membrane protein YckC
MRHFSARETEWLLELDGIELASFQQRALAFLIDWIIVSIVVSAFAIVIAAGFLAYMHRQGRSMADITHMVTTSQDGDKVDVAVHGATKVTTYHVDEHSKAGEATKVVFDVLVPVLYFGILLWCGKGRTPGKRLLQIRVVSLMHRHITFWHSVERALGYGAAALEGGFGFVQFFIHPYRRCAQDRLAETIVVTERGYQGMQHKLQHPLIPDTAANLNAPE